MAKLNVGGILVAFGHKLELSMPDQQRVHITLGMILQNLNRPELPECGIMVFPCAV